jgi:hypothetical protein
MGVHVAAGAAGFALRAWKGGKNGFRGLAPARLSHVAASRL